MNSTDALYDLSGFRRAYQPEKSKAAPATITPPETPKSSAALQRADSAIALEVTSPQLKDHISSPCSEQSAQSSAQSVSVEVAEQMYDIIEDIVERKMSEALGPILLNTRAFAGENRTFAGENNAFSQQIQLHYQYIQKQNNLIDSQTLTLAAAIRAHAEGLTTISKITGQLTEASSSFGSGIHSTVSDTIREEIRAAVKESLQFTQAATSQPPTAVRTSRSSMGSNRKKSQILGLEEHCSCRFQRKASKFTSVLNRFFGRK